MKDLYKRYFCENMFCKKPRRFDCMIITDEGYNGALPYGWKYVSNKKKLFHPTNITAIICDYCAEHEDF